MKTMLSGLVFSLLLGVSSNGTAKVFSEFEFTEEKLLAFSHSLDIHADEEAIKRDYELRVKAEMAERERVRQEEQRKAEEAKREEEKKKREEELRKREEEERLARQEELERQKKLFK